MNCWALGRRGSLSPGDTNDPPHEPRKQADQVLLLRILHIENEILEGFWETRANREGFLDIANADTVCRNGKVKDDVCKSLSHERWGRVHVRNAELLERGQIL